MHQRVLKRITPTRKEMAREQEFAEQLIQRIREMEGTHVDVLLAGSLARNTHLRGDRDLDIFVLFPAKMDREQFVAEGLRIGKRLFKKGEWEEAYSEHPYIRAHKEGYDIEIVPSFKVSAADLLQSSVDRTPFHTAYLRQQLSEKQRGEVRLLRQFLKGMDAYGAEVRVSSVPGYVTELLILKYGTFSACLKEMGKWRIGEVIDLEKHHSEEIARQRFDAPLIVVDPVDPNRNVAAALSLTQFSRMVAASRNYLKKPAGKFFFPKPVKAWPPSKIQQVLRKKELIAVQMKYPKVLPDVMWGQLKRFSKKLGRQLEREGFEVRRVQEWLDENKSMFIVLDLGQLTLPSSQQRIGPLAVDDFNSQKFLKSHPKPLSGPRIEEGRWVLEVIRNHTHASDYLKQYLMKSGKGEHLNIRTALKGAKILDEKDILKWYRKHKGFSVFLTEYLIGKEPFV